MSVILHGVPKRLAVKLDDGYEIRIPSDANEHGTACRFRVTPDAMSAASDSSGWPDGSAMDVAVPDGPDADGIAAAWDAYRKIVSEAYGPVLYITVGTDQVRNSPYKLLSGPREGEPIKIVTVGDFSFKAYPDDVFPVAGSSQADIRLGRAESRVTVLNQAGLLVRACRIAEACGMSEEADYPLSRT